jgi:hypothetical protein
MRAMQGDRVYILTMAQLVASRACARDKALAQAVDETSYEQAQAEGHRHVFVFIDPGQRCLSEPKAAQPPR